MALVVAAILVAAPATATAGDGTFPDSGSRTFASVLDPNDIAVGDFNSDGRQDLVVADDEDGDFQIALGTGNGSFVTSPIVSVGNSEINTVLVADVDADGIEDLLIAGKDDELVVVYLGAGNGTFAAQPSYDIGTSANGVAIALAHADGSADQAADLVSVVDATAFGGDVLTVRPGNGFGTFGAVSNSIPLGDVGPEAIAIADFNNDGKDDAAVANSGSDDVEVRLGIAGGFAFAADDNQVGADPRDIAAGDFNGDGAEDLVTASVNRVSVLLGHGDGTFSINTDYADPNAYSVAVGDFNSDGIQDLATTGASPDGFSIHLGVGDGTFAASADHVLPDVDPRSVVVGDFNGDGTQDLAMANNDPDTVTIRDGAGPPADAGNLLVNGDAEAASGSAAPHQTGATASIPGWTTSGTFTNYRYGIGGAAYPDRLLAPLLGGQEAYFTIGYSTTQSSASQTVDVSGSSASIDGGVATVKLTGYLGGFKDAADTMQVTASFNNAAGAALGAPVQIGPVTVADRHKLTTMLFRSATGGVPAGTRSVTVTLTGVHTDPFFTDAAYADRIGLFLTTPEPPPAPPPPGGGNPAGTTAPETTITKEPKAKSAKAKAKYKFTSSEPSSTFECTFDSKTFKPCSSPSKFKRLDFGKHKFAVRAIDAAGNTDQSPDKDKFKRKG